MVPRSQNYRVLQCTRSNRFSFLVFFQLLFILLKINVPMKIKLQTCLLPSAHRQTKTSWEYGEKHIMCSELRWSERKHLPEPKRGNSVNATSSQPFGRLLGWGNLSPTFLRSGALNNWRTKTLVLRNGLTTDKLLWCHKVWEQGKDGGIQRNLAQRFPSRKKYIYTRRENSTMITAEGGRQIKYMNGSKMVANQVFIILSTVKKMAICYVSFKVNGLHKHDFAGEMRKNEHWWRKPTHPSAWNFEVVNTKVI